MASVGFRWLDILEKEFDKAFVDLDLSIGELESEEPDVVFNVRQKLCTLSSCFAQLTHKAQTIFQNSAKIEAELIHMRAEVVENKSKKEILEQELHNLLLQLHTIQLSKIPEKKPDIIKPDINNIRRKLEAELRLSPIHSNPISPQCELEKTGFNFGEVAKDRAETAQLEAENLSLRNTILALNSEVYGAKLAAKYLDKELAGRIQQLQLLGREMRVDVRDKLWRQLESEILLQRHKTVVRACRRNNILLNGNNSDTGSKPPSSNVSQSETTVEHFGDVRSVVVKRNVGQGLGISITGGREHGVPILISELEANGPAAMTDQLYIGDAILYVNDHDLRQACHKEAVDVLQQQSGDCILQVQYIAADDSDNSLKEDDYNFRFFEHKATEPDSNTTKTFLEVGNTPTAPRTPESAASRSVSRNSTIPETYTISNTSYKNIDSINAPIKTTDLKNMDTIFEDSKVNNNLTKDKNLVKNTDTTRNETSLQKDEAKLVNEFKKNTELLNSIMPFMTKSDANLISDLLNSDNTKHILKLETALKKDLDNRNYQSSLNSLNSEHFSSPMQTSADVFQDSEPLSTDITSNDSQSPKNVIKNDDELSSKSEHSLLISNDSDSSPIHKNCKKKHRKHKKKYFGVKTLQNIFHKRDGYSDVSTSDSEFRVEDPPMSPLASPLKSPQKSDPEAAVYKCTSFYPETSPQFEENVHNIISDIFSGKSTPGGPLSPTDSLPKVAPTGNKKYFSLHGQNLRVGKALRLCPNNEVGVASGDAGVGTERRKEKLLARYVYNSNSSSGEGIGDPFFGTPV